MKNLNRILTTLILIGTGISLLSPALADPLPGQHLKFYQMPLNNGATPYLPVPSFPAAPTTLPPYGSVASTAIYPGHDELSTATRTNEFAPWQGTYMADDFADYAGTPVSHVRWWGSYMNGTQPSGQGGVKRFLISFEHNVPASIDPANGQVIPSHPDFFHPGNLHQIVEFTPPVAAGLTPGKFTEKFVPTPGGPVAPLEGLFEYNAELNLGKWFPEAAAKAGENNVYWLKIVALVDAQLDGPLQWGWHNRDWSIPNALAAKPGDTPDGAERVIGGVPGPGGITLPVWHFEDDAVTGGIFVNPQPNMPFMPIVDQNSFAPQRYLPPWDGPSVIGQYSKDLAFELYTPVPEPGTLVFLSMGAIAFIGMRYRRHEYCKS